MKLEKEVYERAEMEVIEFETDDVIATSSQFGTEEGDLPLL